MASHVDVKVIGALCEMRGDFRHCRVDHILGARPLVERFPANRRKLFAEWLALNKDRLENSLLH
jgi:predicted DNA-binding transcriptional regulator YafY